MHRAVFAACKLCVNFGLCWNIPEYGYNILSYVENIFIRRSLDYIAESTIRLIEEAILGVNFTVSADLFPFCLGSVVLLY